MDYKIIYSRRKTISLSVSPDARIIVRAPSSAGPEYIARLIEKRRDWILRALEHQSRYQVKKTFAEGENFLYLGTEYPLRISTPYHRNKVEFNDDEFRLYLVAPAVDRSRIKMLFRQWYIAEARKIVPDRVRHFGELMKTRFGKITIRDTTSRWGSCSRAGNLNFSYKLVLAPIEVLDYVVVHELAHVAHLNHSRKFWERVSMFCPNFKACRAWLKQQGSRLEL